MPEIIAGFAIHRGLLDRCAQEAMLEDLRAVIRAAPLVRFTTAWGKQMSVAMTSAGCLGWVIDRGRYRYADRHPQTGASWPAIPDRVMEIWEAVSGWHASPDCCLINWYREGAKMGLHQDKDEGDFRPPVVSISLGDPARFRMGGDQRTGPTESTILRSGDVVVMGGDARLAYHGIDRIHFGQGELLPEGGRINLTLRVVSST